MLRTLTRAIAVASVAASLLAAADKPEKGFKSLWNGKDFTGWAKPENPDTFTIKDGVIYAQGPRSHLYYTGKVGKHDFKNFIFRIDVMTKQGSNGGVYFHTLEQAKGWPDQGFEVQVNNTHGDWRKTGSLYSVKDNRDKVAEDDKWFTEEIEVVGNKVTTRVDGKVVTEWEEPAGYVHPEFKARKIGHGTFALQGHDPKSVVGYKNIRVKELK